MLAFFSYMQPAQTGVVHAQVINYTVIFGTSGGGPASTITPSGTQTGPPGQYPVSASAGPGYSFSQWTYTGSIILANATSPSTMATINGPGTITATFIQNSYTVTVAVAPSGASAAGCSATGSGSYHYNDKVYVTATAGAGWAFGSWSANVQHDASGYYVVVGTSDLAVTATFAQSTYSVAFATSGGGTSSTSPTDTQSYTLNEVVPISVTTAPGYTFLTWSATGGTTFDSATSASTNAHIVGADTITATFIQNQYSLTISLVGTGCSVTQTPNQATYTYGSSVQLTPVAAVGWTFSGWSGALTGSANPGSVTITDNAQVTATFTQNKYVLTFSLVGTGCSVTTSPNQASYHYGDSVQLTATSGTGYVFSGWSGDLTNLANPANVVVTKNMAITATFTQSAYSVSVTVLPSGGGTVTANPSAPYHYGDNVVLTEIPSKGYTFNGWSGDGTGSDSTRSVTVTGNMAVTVTFTQITYQVTYVTSGGGSGSSTSPSGSQNYTAGSVVSISATDGSGYDFSSWIATGSITFLDASSASTQATINGAGTITATFVEATSSPTPASSSNPSQPSASPKTTASSNPTSNPSPTPIPNSIIIAASTSNGSNVNILLKGDITSATISSATVSTDQSNTITTVSIAVTAQSIINGFENVTIPKTAIPYGTTPAVYINNQPAANQGYTQDSNKYYIWYSTSTPAYELAISFISKDPTFVLPLWVFLSVAVIIVICLVIVFLRKNMGQKGLEDDEYIVSMI